MSGKSFIRSFLIFFFTTNANTLFAAPVKKPQKAAAKEVKKEEKEKVFVAADIFEGYNSEDEEGTFHQLLGNVKITTEDMIYNADVATYYKKKKLAESEGHIRIKGRKRPFEATAGKIKYDLDKKIGYLTDQVKAREGKLSFFTDDLEYHSDKKKFFFEHSARFTEDEMKGSSQRGIIDVKNKFVTLKEDVFVDMPDNELSCQKLTYNQNTEVIKFDQDVKLTIKKNQNYLTTPVEGVYNKKKKKIYLKKGLFHSQKAIGYAGKIEIAQDTKIVKADENIEVVTREDDLFFAQHMTYNTDDETGSFSGNPIIKRHNKNNGDIYIIAEKFTMEKGELPESQHDYDVFDDDDEEEKEEKPAEEPTPKKAMLFKALKEAQIYSKDFQAKASNFVFDNKSGRVLFEGKPVFWVKNSQLTGLDVEMRLKDKEVERLDVFDKAFMVIKDDSGFYNQAKGKSMHIRFFENKLDDLLMLDNVESLLFVMNDGKFVGTNNVKCPKMTIATDDDFNPEKIIFLDQSSAIFTPKNHVDTNNLTLWGFSWRIKERPRLETFKKRLPKTSNIPEDAEFVYDETEDA